MLGENGLIPGNSAVRATRWVTTCTPRPPSPPRVDAKLTPAAEKWADVEGARILEDFFQQVASGADLEEAAARGGPAASPTR